MSSSSLLSPLFISVHATDPFHKNTFNVSDIKKNPKSKLKHLYISKNNITDCELFVQLVQAYMNPFSYVNINAYLQDSTIKSDPENDIDYTYSDMQDNREILTMEV